MANVAFPPSPRTGQRYFHIDNFLEYVWNGTNWILCNAGPRMQVAKSASTKNQALSAVAVRVYWDSLRLNAGGGVLTDPGAQGGSSRWQPGVSGTYVLQFSCGINNNSAANEGLILSIRVNGSDAYMDQRWWPPSTNNLNVCLTAITSLSATDFVECWASVTPSPTTATLLFTGTGGGNFSIFSGYLLTSNSA